MRSSARCLPAVIFSLFLIPLSGSLFVFNVAAAADQHQQPNPFRCEQAGQDSTTLTLAVDDLVAVPSLSRSSPAKLAIGAMIPPTEGRFIADGDHWYFVADFPEFSAVVLPKSMRKQELTNLFRAAATKTNVTAAADFGCKFGTLKNPTSNIVIALPDNPLRTDRQVSRFAFDEHANENYRADFPDRIAVAENLMLGRVTERIAGDQSGVHWMVSGEIIERHGRPCLFLHTAERSAPDFSILHD